MTTQEIGLLQAGEGCPATALRLRLWKRRAREGEGKIGDPVGTIRKGVLWEKSSGWHPLAVLNSRTVLWAAC